MRKPRAIKTSKNTKRKTPVSARSRRHGSDDALSRLFQLSSDWYWEQDKNLRFVRFSGGGLKAARVDTNAWLGKTREEIPGLVVDAETRATVQAKIAAREPYDLRYRRVDPDGTIRHLVTRGTPVFDAAGRFTGYRGIARDVTERLRDEQLLALEHAVNRCVADATSVSEGIKASMRAVCETEDWACGRYFRVDEKARVLRFAEAWSVPGESMDRFMARSRDVRYAPGDGLLGRVWQSEQPLWIADIAKDSRVHAGIARDIGMHGAFLFPVLSEGKTIGVISFHSRQVRQPEARLLQAIGVIGSQIGQFVERKYAEEVLRENEARFRSLAELSADNFWETDDQHRFTQFTGHARNESSQASAGFIGKKRWEREYLNMSEADWAAHIALLDARQPFHELELCRLDESGNRLWIRVSGEPIFDDKNRFVGYRGVGKDITERKLAEQATLRLGRMFAALSSTNDAILHAQSREDLYRQVCNAAVDGGKFSNTTILMREADASRLTVVASVGEIQEEMNNARFSIDDTIAEGRGLVGTAFRTQRPCITNDFTNDERTRPWHEIGRNTACRSAATLPLIRGGHSVGVLVIHDRELNAFDDEITTLLERMAANVSYALANFEHETERREAQERIEHLATHDGLTDLPNRVMFSQVLNLAIQSARRYERRFAVLFIDLDRFKIINDTLGHEAGDMLLKEMSQRIKDNLRSSDLVARLGGDEFVVLVQEINEPEQVAIVARKLLSTVIKPIMVLGQECRVTASIGVSMFPADAEDEQSLMKNADIAMYLAKAEGKNNFQFYSAQIKSQSLERLTMETSLRRALEREEFFLHYQAKLDLTTGAITGVETLVRWQHPDLGLVSPLQFIPLAEETGLIVPIGKWVLRTACAQNVAWQRAGLPPVCMAVNLSPRQFADENLLNDIAAVLQETGMTPELLELEITESMVMGNVERAAKQLTAIKQMGVRLAIDDFGTGYSSLAQIKRFPIDTIKVDRSFIRELPQDTEDKAITEAIIAMGKSLSLTVVAEGVETEAQQTFLREHACDEMQGYYFSKPIAPENFAELLRTHVSPAKRLRSA